MSRTRWTVAAVLALAPCALAPRAAHAVTEANFIVSTTADLVELCDAKPDNAMGIAAVNFCYGFAQGVVITELQNLGTSRDPKLFCLPDPLPRRSDTLSAFVPWARASQARLNGTPSDALIGFLAEHYPCAKTR